MVVEPPLTLYVHLPWCVRKCPYCDFNSHRAPETLPETDYLEALLRDLDMAGDGIAGRPLRAIFFGGGTPSLFSAQSLGRLLDAAESRLGFADDIEITLEANPGTIEHGRFADYRHAGINRISLGVQSFDDDKLKVLGRIHDGNAAHRAIDELHAAGLSNFNLDLMFGLPGQDVAGAVADVEQAIAAEPAHVSHYELTLEPNTLFAVKPPEGLPDDDLQIDILDACSERFEDAGFSRYEISAWSQPGRQGRHNLNYWTFGDYLGIGAGAHGKITRDGRIFREARQRHPEKFMQTAGSTDVVQDRREPSAGDLVFEFMLNATRLADGVEDGLFESRTGLDAGCLQDGLARAEENGWLDRHGESGFAPTASGLAFLNEVQALFLPDSD